MRFSLSFWPKTIQKIRKCRRNWDSTRWITWKRLKIYLTIFDNVRVTPVFFFTISSRRIWDSWTSFQNPIYVKKSFNNNEKNITHISFHLKKEKSSKMENFSFFSSCFFGDFRLNRNMFGISEFYWGSSCSSSIFSILPRRKSNLPTSFTRSSFALAT